MASSHLIYFGTYTKTDSRGIYSARLDDETGALSAPIVAAETSGPTWLTFNPAKTRLYAVNPSKAQAVGFEVLAPAGTLRPMAAPATAKEAAGGPCHLVVDATNRVLVGANYGEGYVEALPIQSDGTLGAPNVVQHTGHGTDLKRQDKPHVHSVTLSPDNRYVIVCDLGLDKVFTYALDLAGAKLTQVSAADTPAGSGPRHFKFSNDGKHGYCLTEMGSLVVAFDYDSTSGRLTQQQTISTMPADYRGEKWSAEIRVHPNGKFLYASNRAHDSIAVFAIDAASGRLTLVEIVPSGGKTPRNFALSPNGKWLVCAHQDSNNVTVFRVDADSGRLARTSGEITVPMSVCVLFYD